MSRREARRVKATPAGYPNKKSLTHAEMQKVLQSGPELEWFEGDFAEKVIDLTGTTSHSYGYVHSYLRNGAFRYDFAAWDTKEGLARGLEDLWHDHGGTGIRTDRTYPRCDECISVQYFTADVAPRLFTIVEPDGVGEEEVPWSTVTRPIGDSTAGEDDS